MKNTLFLFSVYTAIATVTITSCTKKAKYKNISTLPCVSVIGKWYLFYRSGPTQDGKTYKIGQQFNNGISEDGKDTSAISIQFENETYTLTYPSSNNTPPYVLF